MNSSPEEQQIIETVLAYCENKSTHQEADVMRVAVGEYTDPQHLNLEMTTLFRRFPIVVAHASALAEPGQFLTQDLAGVPLLLTRARDGAVRAFINVCRHRGAKLAHEPCGRANTFACPYHGWTYGLDGALRGIRQPAGFGDIDKQALGLVELPAFERFGLLWARPSPSTQPIDMDAWLAPMAEQMNALNLAEHTVFKQWTIPLQMNWHIALEGFQEQYHFCAAHKQTACAAYLDNQGVFLDQYPHVRHAVPITGVDRLADVPVAERDYRRNFMTQNYLFPCHFAQVMTDHVYIHTIVPTGIDSCTFNCIMLIPEPARSEKARQHWQANYNVVKRVFDEDFAIGESIQAGLASGANEHFTIGRYEAGLQLGRKALQDALAGRLEVPVAEA